MKTINVDVLVSLLNKEYNSYTEEIILMGCDNINRNDFMLVKENINIMKQITFNIINRKDVSSDELITMDKVHNNIMNILSIHYYKLNDIDKRMNLDVIMHRIESMYQTMQDLIVNII